MTSSFVLSKSRTRSSIATLKRQSKVLGQTYPSTYSFCTQFLDVTRHLASTGSERELLSRHSKLDTHFINRLKYCIRNQVPLTISHVLERKHWWYYTMETRLTAAWTPCGISGSVRIKKVASSTSYVHPRALQPTPGAAMYHSLRVYLQVQELKGSAGGLRPTELEWQQCDMGFVPLQTYLAPAPENLFRVIRCNCMADCSTLRCTCKKHSIECSPACGNCRGYGCTNTLQMPCGDDEDHDIAYLM